MQNQREKISILEPMFNLRQNHLHLTHIHLHPMRIHRKINLAIVDEGLLNGIMDVFGNLMIMIGCGVQMQLTYNILWCVETIKIQLMLTVVACLKNNLSINNG